MGKEWTSASEHGWTRPDTMGRATPLGRRPGEGTRSEPAEGPRAPRQGHSGDRGQQDGAHECPWAGLQEASAFSKPTPWETQSNVSQGRGRAHGGRDSARSHLCLSALPLGDLTPRTKEHPVN